MSNQHNKRPPLSENLHPCEATSAAERATSLISPSRKRTNLGMSSHGKAQPLREREPASFYKVPSNQTQNQKTGSTTESPSRNPKMIRVKEDPMIVRPTVSFKDIGGQDKTLYEVCRILVHLKHPEVFTAFGVSGAAPRGILLHGPPGSGKTLLAHAVAGELQIPMLKVAAPEIVSGISGDSEERLREIFQKAETYSPCILFFDEIDAITPKPENASKDMERRIVAQLRSCLDDLAGKPLSKVFVIGATSSPDLLDPSLRRAGRFDREISLGIPNESSRLQILKILSRDLKVSMSVDWQELAHRTPGFVGADLQSLLAGAAMCAVDRRFTSRVAVATPPLFEEQTNDAEMEVDGVRKDPAASAVTDSLKKLLELLGNSEKFSVESLADVCIDSVDFYSALKQVQPSSKREGFATVPDVSWEDVGALSDVREELELAILAPVKYPEEFEKMEIQNSSGILLCGPPGCGKTLLAKAVANESGLSFISVKGPELLNMYVGESERAVRSLFQRARSSAPCVIFFDEIDALCPRRSQSGENNATSRVVNQMLTELDGLESRKTVFVIGATNRPDILDPAILRPGRFDKLVFVDLPDEKARLDILKTVTKNGTKPPFDSDVDFEELARSTPQFSGADVVALVREASKLALRERLKIRLHERVDRNGEGESKEDVLTVKKIHVDEARKKIKPSVTDETYHSYEELKDRLKRAV